MKRLFTGLLLACTLSLISGLAQAQCCYNNIGWSGALSGSWNYQVAHLDAGPTYIQGLLPASNLDWSGAPTADFSSPTARTLSLATAFQASDTTKPAVVTVNLTSNASLTLGGGTTNTGIIVIGPTSAVASGTGTTVGTYSNSLTGSLVVGVAINTVSTAPITFALPKGWYFAILQQTGTISIASAFNQSLG